GTINYALAVRLVEGVGDPDAVLQGLLQRKRALGETLRERLSREQLHDEILRVLLSSDVVERADMGMRKLRDGSRLALEALADLGRSRQAFREDLDRDLASETRVPRAVDLSHPSGAERCEDLVGAELRAGSEGHDFFFRASAQLRITMTGLIPSSAAGSSARKRPSGATS